MKTSQAVKHAILLLQEAISEMWELCKRDASSEEWTQVYARYLKADDAFYHAQGYRYVSASHEIISKDSPKEKMRVWTDEREEDEHP